MRARLAKFGEWQLEDDDAVWREIRDVTALIGEGDVWRVSARPTDGPSLAAKVAGADVIYDWGGGLIWLQVPEGTDVRAALGEFSGHATLVRAAPETKARLGVFHPASRPVAAIEAGLRARFDPRAILNPGLMTPQEGAA